MANNNFRELTVYKKAFALAIQIFHITKKFPVDEKFGLTSQKKKFMTLSHMITFPEKYINQKDKIVN